MNRLEFKRFLLIARASNCELQTQLEIASLLGLGDSSLFDQPVALSHEVGKMLFALLDQLKIKSG